jgi:hypothetical protein
MYIFPALLALLAVSVQAEFRYRCCMSGDSCNDCIDANCASSTDRCRDTQFKFCNDVSPRVQQIRTASLRALIPDTVRPRK